MAKESDARIERLKKDSQESRAQIAEMMELIRTLIRDKGQASGPNPQNETVQTDQRKEDVIYPPGYTPRTLQTSTWRKPRQCNKLEGSLLAIHLPQRVLMK